MNHPTQDVSLGSVLHQQIKVPIAVLVLLEKAVVELNKVAAWELFEEEGLLLHLQFHIVGHRLAHEDSLKGHETRHFAGPCVPLVHKFHQVNVSKAA